jgi:heterodisulfide reductase subunit C
MDTAALHESATAAVAAAPTKGNLLHLFLHCHMVMTLEACRHQGYCSSSCPHQEALAVAVVASCAPTVIA